MKKHEPRLNFIECPHAKGAHNLAYWEWGDPDNGRVLLCVHGLTRNGRDFDRLAQSMSARYRVVCPDLPGRGQSDWLSDASLYDMEQYVSDLLVLIARLRPQQIDWVGSSLGGLIGVALMTRVKRAHRERRANGYGASDGLKFGGLVLNDIAPTREATGLQRVTTKVGQALRFNSFEEGVRAISADTSGFPALSSEHWKELCIHYLREQDGLWVKHHDLAIAQAMQTRTPEAMQVSAERLWAAYDRLELPILILRGELSDFLSMKSVEQMLARNSRARFVELKGLAHPPPLLLDDELEPIKRFLLEGLETTLELEAQDG